MVAKVMGIFRTQKALVGLVLTIPEDEYDEDAVVKMIESIRPAPGDSAPDDEAADGAATDGAARMPGNGSQRNEPPKSSAPDGR